MKCRGLSRSVDSRPRSERRGWRARKSVKPPTSTISAMPHGRVGQTATTGLVALAHGSRYSSDPRLTELETLQRARADLHNFVESTNVLAIICDKQLKIA